MKNRKPGAIYPGDPGYEQAMAEAKAIFKALQAEKSTKPRLQKKIDQEIKIPKAPE